MSQPNSADSNWRDQYKKFIKKRKQNGYIAVTALTPILWAGTFFLAATGGLMVFAAFPWISPIGAAGLILGGFIVDALVYLPSSKKSVKIFFGHGMYQELEDTLRIQAVEKFLSQYDIKSLAKNATAKKILRDVMLEYSKKHYLTAEELKQKPHQRHISHLFRRKLAQITARKHKFYRENSNKTEDNLSDLIQAYDKTFQEAQFKSNYYHKRRWLNAAFLGAFASGLALFAIIAAENLEFWGIVSLATPAGSAILLAAAIVGIMQGLLFYKSLQSVIVNGFWQKLWHTLKFKHVKTHDKTRSTLASLPKNLLKWGLIIAIVPLSIVSLLLTQSTIMTSVVELLHRTTEFFSAWNWAIQGQTAVNIMIQTIMYGILLPTSFVFTVKHTVGACNKLTNSIATGIDWLSQASFLDCVKRPDKTIFYSTIYLIIFSALIIHTFTEAMMESGQGVNNPVGIIGIGANSFINICSRLGISPSKAAASTQMIQETAEHGDFICKNGQLVIQLLESSVCNDTLKPEVTAIVDNEQQFINYTKSFGHA